MPPDTHPPVYDSHGNQVPAWRVVCEFMPSTDQIVVAWHQDGGPYNAAKTHHLTLNPVDVEDALEAVQRAIRIMSARRLF